MKLVLIIISWVVAIFVVTFGFNPKLNLDREPVRGVIELNLPADTSYTSTDDYDQSDFYKRQIYCMAIAMYGEARGESVEGMRAVGHVIMNRQASRYFPTTVCEVTTQRWQFESLYKTRLAKLLTKIDTSMYPSKYNIDRFNKMLDLSTKIYWGIDKDITGGATHFWSPSVQFKLKRQQPKWATTTNHVATVDNHKFHKPY